MDDWLRALPGLVIVLGLMGLFVLGGRSRNRTVSNLEAQTKLLETNIALNVKNVESNARLEELRRSEIDLLERIAVALESKRDRGRSD
jgi:hypothetical protein